MFGFPIEGSGDRPLSRRRATSITAVAVALAVLILILMSAAPEAVLPAPGAIWIGVLVVVTLLTLIPMVILNVLRGNTRQKGKRGMNGLDMYSLIDRMVDDLDNDEMDYLRRRLEEREHRPKNELAESLDELLSQRAEDRKSGQR